MEGLLLKAPQGLVQKKKYRPKFHGLKDDIGSDIYECGPLVLSDTHSLLSPGR